MSVKLKTTQHGICRECGRHFEFPAGQRPKSCVACGIARLHVAVEAAFNREGPVYERTVAGQLRHWLSEARRLGIEVEMPPAAK